MIFKRFGALCDVAMTSTGVMVLVYSALAYVHSISTKVWTTRRSFDEAKAIQSGIWKPKDGGLNCEDRRILGQVYFESNSVFESGVGESTLIAMYTGIPRYTGCDTSVKWLEQMSVQAPPHYRFHWNDVGPVKGWGNPNSKASMSKYAFASTAALDAEGRAFDFYFIDGRFRVATFAMAFLHAIAHKARKFKVGIHDIRFRPEYNACFKIGIPVHGYRAGDSRASLTIFERNFSVPYSEIVQVWKEHAFIEK